MNQNIEGYTTLEAKSRGCRRKDSCEVQVPHSASWNHLIRGTPTLAQERWRIVDEGDRWVIWFVPQNHPHLWRELADFSTEPEAVDFMKSL